jgi:hypothetical protein
MDTQITRPITPPSKQASVSPTASAAETGGCCCGPKAAPAPEVKAVAQPKSAAGCCGGH